MDFALEDVDLQYEYEQEHPRFPVVVSTDGKDLEDATLYQFEDMDVLNWSRNESDTVATFNLKVNNSGCIQRQRNCGGVGCC